MDEGRLDRRTKKELVAEINRLRERVRALEDGAPPVRADGDLSNVVVFAEAETPPNAAEVFPASRSPQPGRTDLQEDFGGFGAFASVPVADEGIAELQRLIAALPCPAYIKGLDGVFIGCNPALEEIAGLPADQILGRKVSDLTAPEFAEQTAAMDQALAREPAPQIFESSLLGKNGAQRHVSFNRAPFFDKAGRLAGLIGIVVDITGYKSTENALLKRRDDLEEMVRQRTAEMLALLNASVDAACLIDLDGHLMALNDQAGRTLGKSVWEALGLNLYDLFPEPVRESRRKRVNEAMRAGRPARLEDEFAGQFHDISIHPVADNAGNVIRLAIFARDVTERRHAEEERVRAATEREAARQTARLHAITSKLSAAATPRAVSGILISQARSALNAKTGVVALLTADGRSVQVIDDKGLAPDTRKKAEALGHVIPLATLSPLSDAARTGQTVCLNSAAAIRERYPDVPILSEDNALLAVPLQVENRVVGVFGLSFAERREFDREDMAFITSLAQQCAQSLERAMLYEASVRLASELEQRVGERTAELEASYAHLEREFVERQRAEVSLKQRAEEFAALYLTSIEINSQPDLPTLLHTIVARAASLLDGSMGGLYLMQPDGTLKLEVNYNLPGDFRNTILKLGEGVAGRVAESGNMLVIPDHLNWDGRAKSFRGAQIRRILGLPLKVGSTILGAVTISDRERVGLFSEDQIRLASLFAEQASVAVENARLYQQLQSELSERRRVEDRLRESEHRYRTLTESSRDAIWLVDPSYRFRYVNRAGERLLGRPANEIISHPVEECLGAQWGPRVMENLASTFAIGQAIAVEDRVQASGRDVWLDTNIIPLPADDGHIENIMVVSHDTTERRQFEEELFRSREMLQLVLDTIPQGVFWKDRDLKYLGANRTFARDAGASSPDEIVGLVDSELPFSPGASRYHKQDLQILRSGRPLLIPEASQTDLQGQTRWVRLQKVPLHDLEGNTIGILGAYDDVTEQRRAQQALKESEQRFRMSVETMLDGFAILSPVSDEAGAVVDLRYDYINSAGCALNRRPREAHIGHTMLEVLPNLRDSDLFRDYVRLLAEGGFLVRNAQTDPGTSLADPLCIVFDLQAVRMADRIVVAWRDVTARARAEEELRLRNEELQSRNEELDAFAHSVAHDLKSPLATVVGFAELMTTFELTHEQQTDSARSILTVSRDMVNIIQDLLLLAEVRKTDVPRAPLDMSVVVDETLERIRSLVDQQHAEIVVLAAGAWPMAVGYKPWLVHVWANYISNAIKYGGRPPRVELGADTDTPGWVRFWVRDNGDGIEERDQTRLFTQFTRLDRSRAEGSGLGLSIVRRVIDKLGGQIGVVSKPGSGSTFFFTLPAAS